MFGRFATLSAFAAAMSVAGMASATTYTTSFEPITTNSGLQTQVAAELSASWTLVSPTDLRVVVSFFGSTPGTVEELYFRDTGSVLGSISVTGTSDPTHIQFGLGASPGQLPGDSSYSVDAVSAAHNGENDSCSHTGRGLCLGNTLTLDITTSSLTDTILANDLNADILGIGAHVVAIGSTTGTSDAFVSLPPTGNHGQVNVPEPGSLALLGAGLLGLARVRRRR